MSAFKIPLKDGLQGREFQLEPLDQVRIADSELVLRRCGGADGRRAVPRRLSDNLERNLSSVLLRAGGMAENAFPEAAVLIKVEAKA